MASPSSKSVTINEYSPLQGGRRVAVAVTGVFMVFSSRSSFIENGSFIFNNFLAGKPSAIKYTSIAQNVIFYILFGVHLVEAVPFDRKITDHGVRRFSAVWWKWMVTCFVGGGAAFAQLDELVARKKAN